MRGDAGRAADGAAGTLKFPVLSADQLQVMKWLFFLVASAALAQTPVQPGSGVGTRNAIQEALAKQRAAAAIQREAVRKQAEMAAQWRAPAISATDAPEAECSPIADVELTRMIDAAAQTHSVQPKLLRAVMEQESGFRPCAVSPKGAQGLMQLMPDTAGELGLEDPFDPKQNIDAGAQFLKQLLDKYKGDLPLALGAYNAGPTTVDQTGKVPDIPETRDYVAAILKRLAAAPPSEPKLPPPIVPPR
jgi:soluble lytic murein transglycosylase-like protein